MCTISQKFQVMADKTATNLVTFCRTFYVHSAFLTSEVRTSYRRQKQIRDLRSRRRTTNCRRNAELLCRSLPFLSRSHLDQSHCRSLQICRSQSRRSSHLDQSLCRSQPYLSQSHHSSHRQRIIQSRAMSVPCCRLTQLMPPAQISI